MFFQSSAEGEEINLVKFAPSRWFLIGAIDSSDGQERGDIRDSLEGREAILFLLLSFPCRCLPHWHLLFFCLADERKSSLLSSRCLRLICSSREPRDATSVFVAIHSDQVNCSLSNRVGGERERRKGMRTSMDVYCLSWLRYYNTCVYLPIEWRWKRKESCSLFLLLLLFFSRMLVPLLLLLPLSRLSLTVSQNTHSFDSFQSENHVPLLSIHSFPIVFR